MLLCYLVLPYSVIPGKYRSFYKSTEKSFFNKLSELNNNR